LDYRESKLSGDATSVALAVSINSIRDIGSHIEAKWPTRLLVFEFIFCSDAQVASDWREGGSTDVVLVLFLNLYFI
jgi:hypothetical protein